MCVLHIYGVLASLIGTLIEGWDGYKEGHGTHLTHPLFVIRKRGMHIGNLIQNFNQVIPEIAVLAACGVHLSILYHSF